MKKLTIFESSIIGFFVGVIVSAYLAYLVNIKGFIGQILYWISLTPILERINTNEGSEIYISFIFYIIVFTIYGALIGLIHSKSSRNGILILVLAILAIAASIFDQVSGTTKHVINDLGISNNLASVVFPERKKPAPQQYFGNEARGDLNGDNRDDVAFIVSRNDQERGILYYLISALAADDGYRGTNLIFIGEKLVPTKITITDGIISIEYMEIVGKTSTSTNILYANVKDGILDKTLQHN